MSVEDRLQATRGQRGVGWVFTILSRIIWVASGITVIMGGVFLAADAFLENIRDLRDFVLKARISIVGLVGCFVAS